MVMMKEIFTKSGLGDDEDINRWRGFSCLYMKTLLCFSVVDVNWTCLQECVDQSIREGGGNDEWEKEKTHY